MKNLITFFAIVLTTLLGGELKAQSRCVQPDIDSNVIHDIPFFGDNQFLYDLLDSIHLAHDYHPDHDLARIAGTGLSNNFYHVPVSFVIHYANSDTNTNAASSIFLFIDQLYKGG